MVDKGEGDNRYQELKDGIYHGYQPLRARKSNTYNYTPEFMPGALNMFVTCTKVFFDHFHSISAVARDIDSIPSGPKDDGAHYQMVSAHKVNRAPMVGVFVEKMLKNS